MKDFLLARLLHEYSCNIRVTGGRLKDSDSIFCRTTTAEAAALAPQLDMQNS
jgi:hypothetical protein